MPQELRDGFLIEKWGLKRAGGLDDQPAGLMTKITACLNTYRAINSFVRNKKSFAKWADANPEYFGIWEEVRKLRSDAKD